MLRGFRHTLFLLLQVGVVLSGLIALAVRPDALLAIALCVVGGLLSSVICERIASRYLRKSLGELRRATEDISRGRAAEIEAQPGDDFYKLIQAINHVAHRLARLSEEEQRLQEELRRRERLAFLGELAASVAHEINNPLDGVQNCARILRRALDDPDRARQMLDLMDGGLERIELTVRRLLTLARENVIRPTPARMRDVLASAVKLVAERLESTRIGIEQRIDCEDDRVLVDTHLLEQVFVNLMLNAADSMPGGGVLKLAVRREPRGAAVAESEHLTQDAVCVDVIDQGGGIPPDVLPHIFEPFYTTKKAGRGTGLGLPIAARIVDAHRGRIHVTPGPSGACFTVRIAARAQSTPAEPATDGVANGLLECAAVDPDAPSARPQAPSSAAPGYTAASRSG